MRLYAAEARDRWRLGARRADRGPGRGRRLPGRDRPPAARVVPSGCSPTCAAGPSSTAAATSRPSRSPSCSATTWSRSSPSSERLRSRSRVIADTHLPRGRRRLPEACVERIRAADLLIHAGRLLDRGRLRGARGARAAAGRACTATSTTRSCGARLPERDDRSRLEGARIGVRPRRRAEARPAGAPARGVRRTPTRWSSATRTCRCTSARAAFRSSTPGARPSAAARRATRWASRWSDGGEVGVSSSSRCRGRRRVRELRQSGPSPPVRQVDAVRAVGATAATQRKPRLSIRARAGALASQRIRHDLATRRVPRAAAPVAWARGQGAAEEPAGAAVRRPRPARAGARGARRLAGARRSPTRRCGRCAAEALHVTLCFLAYHPERDDRADRRADRARSAPRPVEMRFEPEPVAAARRAARACSRSTPRARRRVALQAELSDALEAERFYKPEKRGFWPHVTVARVRSRAPAAGRGERRGKGRPRRVETPPGPLPAALAEALRCRPGGSLPFRSPAPGRRVRVPGRRRLAVPAEASRRGDDRRWQMTKKADA